MADPHIISTLQRKRADIENAIAAYEKKIQTAKRDLAHVNATLLMFETSEGRTDIPVYMDTVRLFKRGEIVNICKAAIVKEGPLDTRELSRRVVKAKKLDEKDEVLRQSIAFRIVQALRLQAKRGTMIAMEKRKGVLVWRMP